MPFFSNRGFGRGFLANDPARRQGGGRGFGRGYGGQGCGQGYGYGCGFGRGMGFGQGFGPGRGAVPIAPATDRPNRRMSGSMARSREDVAPGRGFGAGPAWGCGGAIRRRRRTRILWNPAETRG
ncbi:hypothetical protein GKC30_01005 [Pseudodesulfovibrio sp. F-1]|uniref:Uncharacterized protein n=1 Tax=Pseudodesulfovibrio alkaliphilus TaxID=2661613 RepID=A0A7K1KJJ6_9BACT|nr:hypothetical protein [Pseudodesulfovibrio alkaliphilus]MUM76205.1 hypothetical protein [Pseudodesulfovibrio alkaliphilus]